MPTNTTAHRECARIAADLHALRAPLTQTYPSDAAHLRALELAFQTAVCILYAPQTPALAPPRAAARRPGFQHMRTIIARALSLFRPRTATPPRQHRANRSPRAHAAQPPAPNSHPRNPPAAPEAPTPQRRSEPCRPQRDPKLRSPARAIPEAGGTNNQPPPPPATAHRSHCASRSRQPRCGQNRRRFTPARQPASMCNRPQRYRGRAASADHIRLGARPGAPPRPP